MAVRSPLPESYMKIIDEIGWKTPFFWPLPLPKEINSVDKDSYQQINAESLMDARYSHTIEDEGSKIDINDLASPSKTLREITKKQLLTAFEQKIATDDVFRTEYQNTNFEELVNRIYDWMSDSNTGLGGGDKRSGYSALGPSYPPNRGFRTIEELRLVPGMTDVFYDLLRPRITIYGMKAINPNTSSKEVLLSLDSGMTEEAVTEAIARRDDPDKGGPFKGEKEKCHDDFKTFVEGRGARLTKEFDQIPMICNKVISFRIKSTGLYGDGKFALQKNITAVVLDVGRAAAQIKTYVDKENPPPPPPPGQAPAPAPAPAPPEPLPKGPPRVVYWIED